MNQREKGWIAGRVVPRETLQISGFSVNSLEESEEKWQLSPSTPTIPLFPAVTSSIKINKGSRSFSGVSNSLGESDDAKSSASCCSSIILRDSKDNKIEAFRSQKEKNSNPERISLDRCGLTVIPVFLGESKLKLLSLQHNLLTKLEEMSFECLPQLVFLDIYNNQLEQISALNCLHNLRVLLLGKNRIKKINGLNNLNKLEVLDLHGNQITTVNGLNNQNELKVLNLAGNEIKTIGEFDLKGLVSLQELNLRRNRIKDVRGFGETPQLSKLFLSNNEIELIECVENLKTLNRLKEVSLDGNPVTMFKECALFIASYIPTVRIFCQLPITEDTRNAAILWRLKRDGATLSEETSLIDFKKKNATEKMNRARSAVSENKIAYLRKMKKPFLSEKNSSTSFSSSEKIPKRRLPPRSACISRRNNFAKQKTISCDSGNGSESSTEFFRLPPIFLDDFGVMIRNNANTSLDSNRDGKSIFGESFISSEKIEEHLSESSSNSGYSSQEDDAVIKEEDTTSSSKNFVPTVSRETPIRAKKNMRLKLCRSKSACLGKSKIKNNNKSAVKKSNKLINQQEKVREKGLDYLVEVTGRFFNITGKNSAKYIDRAWNVEKSADVTTVRFSNVDFNSLVPVLNKIKHRFPNAENFLFTDNNISCLAQINALADIQGVTSLCINPNGNLISVKDWHNYAIYRLYHWGLRYIDDILISENQVEMANNEYEGLSEIVVQSLPDELLTPLLNKLNLEVNSNMISPKQWLYKADQSLRNVICKEALQWRPPFSLSQNELQSRECGRQNLCRMVDNTITIAFKLNMLENNFKSILENVVYETMEDYSNMESYVKKIIADLESS